MTELGAKLVFLKLGGALLTHKDGREAVRPEVLRRLVAEIADWSGTHEGRLVLAHGSGSFAHVAVQETGLLRKPGDAMAMARVSDAAARLNRRIVRALLHEDVPAWAVPGAQLAICKDGRVEDVRYELVTAPLAERLVPTLYGDVAPDVFARHAIVSTESLLLALARRWPPGRLILATDVDGVFERDPHRHPDARPLEHITPSTRSGLELGAAKRGAQDVTGGMAAKVDAMLELVAQHPGTEVRVLSGLRFGAVAAALRGEDRAGGTVIAAEPG